VTFRDLIALAYALTGIIVAEDEVTAKHAAHMVEVVYEDLPPIISIREAVAQQSFFPLEKKASLLPFSSSCPAFLPSLLPPLFDEAGTRSRRATSCEGSKSPTVWSRAKCASVRPLGLSCSFSRVSHET